MTGLVPLIRLAQQDVRADLISSAPGLAKFLRLIAARIESASHEDLDDLAAVGITLALVGETLRDEALRVRP
jgi:hypothetical protein